MSYFVTNRILFFTIRTILVSCDKEGASVKHINVFFILSVMMQHNSMLHFMYSLYIVYIIFMKYVVYNRLFYINQ